MLNVSSDSVGDQLLVISFHITDIDSCLQVHCYPRLVLLLELVVFFICQLLSKFVTKGLSWVIKLSTSMRGRYAPLLVIQVHCYL